MLQLTLGVAIVAALYYFICVKPMRYWKNRGIQQTNPIWLFGDSWSTLMRQESTSDQAVRCYNQFPGVRYFGWYQFSLPTLMIKDPELIKQITVKDFDHFTDHRSFFPEDVEPLWSKNLFALTGKKWRDMRPILSPTFTSSKMRTMFLLISDCSEKFVKHFVENNENCIEIEMKNIFTRFTNDVIATTAFGVEVDSMKQPNNEFYLMGKEVNNSTGFWRLLKIFGYFIIPSVYHFFRISVSPFTKKISMFFRELVDDTIKFREENNIVRPDMIHLLMESRKGIEHKEENVDIGTGFATVEESFMGKGISGKEITNTDITAQALIFFFAGFEQVSSLMCFMALELAIHDDVQTRLREEIKKTISSCGGNLTYEALMKMKYMDMVVSETLRKWPTTVLTDRICTKAYIIEPQNPGEQPLHLERNANITIPMFAIHRDPKYYPDPDRFDPERFNDENKLKINPYTYAPFGFGPRNCIGSRFALLETKLIFFHLLSHFELVPVKKTCTPLRASKKSFNLVADGGFWVGMRKLTKSMKSTLSTHT
nr:cytochrome P450 9e2-like isoform X1 [Leptinotarsa decemlineata]